MRGRRPLDFEPLSDRITPAVFGTPWPGSTLTLSFAPDGTDVNGTPSDTTTAFAGIPTEVWQGEVLRAFQTWAVTANVNVAVVADGGQPLGTPGAPQGDTRFGDIRIAAVPLTSAAALAAPFDVNAGSRSGDVWFNSTLPFTVGGATGNDVYSVALHEAGHVFGVPESDDPSSAMYDVALPRTGLSAADVTAMVALYGARQPDAFDAKGGNDTAKTATPLQVGSGPGSSFAANVSADITTTTDVDTFVFQPSNLRGAGLTATVHVNGISSLVPWLQILDASGKVISSATSTTPGRGDVSVHLDSLVSGATYYARVSSGRADLFGIGGYRLELHPDATSTSGGGSQLVNPDAGSNDTLGTASQVGQQFITVTSQRTAYNLTASLNTSTDVDVYRIKSPQSAGSLPTTLTASVWTAPLNATDPVVDVYDSRGNRVTAAVLVHDGGAFTVQVANAASNADYFIAVRHAHPGAGAVVGNYFLNVEFGGAVTQLTTAAAGQLSDDVPVSISTLTVGEPQVLHLVLDLTGNPPSTAVAQLVVLDSAGVVVATRLVAAGDSASLNVFLQPGDYRILVGAGTTDGTVLNSLAFTLRGLVLSDPIGPQPVTATPPAGSPPRSTQPPITWFGSALYAPIRPVTPTTPAWWIAPPTEWTSVANLLAALILK